MKKKHNIFVYINAHLPWLLMMGLLTAQSAIPRQALTIKFSSPDKIIHFLIFGILGWLLSRAFDISGGIFKRGLKYLPAIFIGVLFALVDEYHQGYVTGRSQELYDVIADIAGVLTFTTIYKWHNKNAIPTQEQIL